MIVTERRLDMYVISPEMLAQYMEYNGYTVRTLAAEVEREVRRKTKDKTFSFKHATLGHLRNPKSDRRYCNPVVAATIEDLLKMPRGSLFAVKMSSVQREKGRVA